MGVWMPRRVSGYLRQEWDDLVQLAHSNGYFLSIRPWTSAGIRMADLPTRISLLRNHLTLMGVLPELPIVVEGLNTPAEDEWTFGVEFECMMPRGVGHSQLASKLTEAGIETHFETYGHEVPSAWKIVTDGSLGDYQSGAEVVSPILLGSEGLRQVDRVCQVLLEVGCQVNRRCGFHVHVGCQNRPVWFFKNLLRLYAHYEDVLDGLVTPSRRGNTNQYCRSTKRVIEYHGYQTFQDAADVEAVGRVYTGSHYLDGSSGRFVKLNLAAYWRHGTVEFRHHQGTINSEKARTWIRLCLGLATAAGRNESIDLTGEVATLESLASRIGMDDVVPYWQRRRQQLSRISVTERT